MFILALALEFERAEEAHYRREAFLFILHVLGLDGIGTTQSQQTFEFAAVSTGNVIE